MASYFCLGRAEGPNEIDVLQFIRLIMLCICFISFWRRLILS